jgi:hypothetical protein
MDLNRLEDIVYLVVGENRRVPVDTQKVEVEEKGTCTNV